MGQWHAEWVEVVEAELTRLRRVEEQADELLAAYQDRAGVGVTELERLRRVEEDVSAAARQLRREGYLALAERLEALGTSVASRAGA
jgi:hypothetical protein